MKISREEVLRVAELAHLELSGDEVEMYRGQLDEILTYIDKLKELDVSDVEPMAQVLFALEGHSGPSRTAAYMPQPHTDAYGKSLAALPELRGDEIRICDTARAVLRQAPDAARPFFRVPKVIDR
jgi:aspartyl-tRNA(Asn)/glutamyl-tRNA(Gln) amidotransferase subunit C